MKQDCPLLKKGNNNSKRNGKVIKACAWSDNDERKNENDDVADKIAKLCFIAINNEPSSSEIDDFFMFDELYCAF